MKNYFDRKMVQALGAFIAYAVFSAILLTPGDDIIGSPLYLIGAGGMFLSMLWIMKCWPGKRMLAAVLLLALLVRAAAIFQFPENSDINRYIWEGEVQIAGFNPYLLSPDSEALKHLRNENWQDINFKNIPAIYWPFAQTVFKACAAISPTFWFFKTILTLFDVGTIFLLLLMMRPFSPDFRHIVLYALNPLAIIAVSGEGHLESILVFWIMLSLYGCRQKKDWLMYPALGLAAMTKLTPVIFLPLLVERANLKYFPLFLLPFGLMLPYVEPGINFLSSFNLFISDYHFNGLFNYVSQVILGELPSTWLAIFCAVGLSGYVFFLTPDKTRAVFLLSAFLLIFAPTFHTWYLLLITPFLVLYRPAPWIILHATILPLVFFFHPWATNPLWHSKPFLQATEFLPFIAAGIWCFWKNRQHWPARFQAAQSVSVIVPAENEAQDISGCIPSMDDPGCPVEIVRGMQTGGGIHAARNDVIVLLPADSRLLPGAISRMLGALRENDSAVGGCFGAKYDDSGIGPHSNRIPPLLRRLCYVASGIRTGDQVLFFRRGAFDVPSSAINPMAGIELSLRMKEAGATLFVPKGVAVAVRKQVQAGNRTDFIKRLYIMLRYLTLRRVGWLPKYVAGGYPAVPTDPAKKQAA